MNKTGIEYLDYTWNPIVMRCTPCTEGCAHCWHLRMANRLAGNLAIRDDLRAAYAGEEPPVLVEQRLWEPLRRKKPARIGVQFMGDLFHEDVHDHDIFQVWEVMRQAAQHTFIVLTKRSRRAFEWLDYHTWSWLEHHPLPNVWLGVTCENQRTADERIPVLLQTPAAVRWVSYEPALGPVDFWRYLDPGALTQEEAPFERGLDWLGAGAETGPGARPADPAWFRSARDQCREAGVPFFFKGFGTWIPTPFPFFLDDDEVPPGVCLMGDEVMVRTKKRTRYTGLLDGRAWEQWPKVT